MWQSTQGRATPNRSLLWIIPGSVAVPAGMVNGPYRTVLVEVAACAGRPEPNPTSTIPMARATTMTERFTAAPFSLLAATVPLAASHRSPIHSDGNRTPADASPPVLTRHGPLHDANRGGSVWQVRHLDRIRHAVGGPGDAGRMGAEPHGPSWPPSSDHSPGFCLGWLHGSPCARR